jgi:hypothetical protein
VLLSLSLLSSSARLLCACVGNQNVSDRVTYLFNTDAVSTVAIVLRVVALRMRQRAQARAGVAWARQSYEKGLRAAEGELIKHKGRIFVFIANAPRGTHAVEPKGNATVDLPGGLLGGLRYEALNST